MSIAEEVAEDTAAPDANELQEKFDALVEENGKKSRFSYQWLKSKSREDLLQ
jgi:hypothetical protein